MLNVSSGLGRVFLPRDALPRVVSRGLLGALLGLWACSSATFAQSIQQQYLPPPTRPPANVPSQPAANQPAASQPAASQAASNPVCVRLQQQLASVDQGAADPARADQIKRADEAIAKQQADLDRALRPAQLTRPAFTF